MKLSYIYHSGFLVEANGALIIIDYWKDGGESVADLVAETDAQVYVLASHAHADHFNPETLFWKSRRPIRYVFSADIRRRNKPLRDDGRIAWLHRGEVFSDGGLVVEAHGSTDVGVSWLIGADGRRLFHAGDFNDWQHPEATEEDNKRMHSYFEAELRKMSAAVSGVDVALFPADPHLGSHIADGPAAFCQEARPKVFVPMHCWEDYGAAGAVARAVEELGVRFVPCRGLKRMEV